MILMRLVLVVMNRCYWHVAAHALGAVGRRLAHHVVYGVAAAHRWADDDGTVHLLVLEEGFEEVTALLFTNQRRL